MVIIGPPKPASRKVQGPRQLTIREMAGPKYTGSRVLRAITLEPGPVQGCSWQDSKGKTGVCLREKRGLVVSYPEGKAGKETYWHD